MKIVFFLTEAEKEFLKELTKKDTPKNQWSGHPIDDAFRAKHDKQIKIFTNANLTEKKDGGGDNEYWAHGLNARGLMVQSWVLLGSDEMYCEVV